MLQAAVFEPEVGRRGDGQLVLARDEEGVVGFDGALAVIIVDLADHRQPVPHLLERPGLELLLPPELTLLLRLFDVELKGRALEAALVDAVPEEELFRLHD